MRRRKSDLGYRTRKVEARRRLVANQTEEERALSNEKKRRRMAQMRAERRAARLENAQSQQSCSVASKMLRSHRNKRKKSNLGRHTRAAERRRRLVANQTEEERALSNEKKRQEMAQIRAQRRAVKLADARLRAHQSCSAASDLLRSEQNECYGLKVDEGFYYKGFTGPISAEILMEEYEESNSNNLNALPSFQYQTRFCAQQLCDYNRLGFRYNPANDCNLSRHVLIGTMIKCVLIIRTSLAQ